MEIQKEWWMHVDSYKDLVRAFRKIGNSVEKDLVFDYYANRSDKEGHEIFLGLLDAGFYSTNEVARKFYYTGVVNAWSNSESVTAVLNYIRPAIKLPKYKDRKSFDERYYKILEYYATQNEDNFKKMLNALPPLVMYRRYFAGDEQNRSLQRAIYNENPDLVLSGAVDYYAWRAEEDLPLRREIRIEKKFKDWGLVEQMLKAPNPEHIKRFIELNLITKETLVERFSKEEIENSEVLTHFMAPDAWKYFDSPNFIYELIPADQKWDAFVYLIENKPDVVRYFKNNISDYYPAQIAKHFETEDLSGYSEVVQNYLMGIINQRKINNEKARARERNSRPKLTPEQKMWYDKGKLCQFFSLIGGRPVRTIDEYYKIVTEFIQSGLTTDAFCVKYKISSVKDFRTFLNRLARYDERIGEALQYKNGTKRQQFIDSTKNFVEGVITDGFDVTREMNKLNPKSQSFSDIYEFIGSTYDNPKIKKAFTFKIVTHYFKRLNECGDGIDAETLSKRLTTGEIGFIMGATNLAVMKSESTFDVPKAFIDMIAPERDELATVFHKLVYGRDSRKISVKLQSYENRFQPNSVLGMRIGSIGGADIEVTKDVLGQIEAFRAQHSLFPSDRTMTSIIRGIASGQIKIDGDASKARLEQLSEVREKAKTCESIDEYFEILSGV